ncbi:MAG: tetratricopeptide repeat protein [bacterium]
MGRFENLELEIKKKPEKSDTSIVYDEVHYLNLAKEAQINGDFEAALRYFSRALNYRLGIPEAWVGQVLCLIDLGELNEAVIWADKAIEVIGTGADILAVKAMALGRLGEYERALAYSDQAMKKGGASSIIWVARGDIIITADERGAEFCFRKALETDHKNPYTYLRIGIAYISIKNYKLALVDLKKALELKPISPLINYLIGVCYQKLGYFDIAKQYYDQELRINPDYQKCIEAYKKLCRFGIFEKIYCWFISLFRK